MNRSELSRMAGAIDDSTINIVVVIIIIIRQYLLFCRKCLLELVHSCLQQITARRQSDDGLPVSVVNISSVAEQFLMAADVLPSLLVHSEGSEKQVYLQLSYLCLCRC